MFPVLQFYFLAKLPNIGIYLTFAVLSTAAQTNILQDTNKVLCVTFPNRFLISCIPYEAVCTFEHLLGIYWNCIYIVYVFTEKVYVMRHTYVLSESSKRAAFSFKSLICDKSRSLSLSNSFFRLYEVNYA